MKNRIDMPIFHTAICAGASQIATHGRRELDVLVATPSLRSGMEIIMKSLNKRVFRELKAHFGRYFALFLMIVLGMYLVVSVAGMAETTIDGSNRYNEECRIQDGQFTVFTPLTESQLTELSNKYGDIERMFSIDAGCSLVEDNNGKRPEKTIRVFRERERINLLNLDSGRLPKSDNEIVVMNLFARNNGLKEGDSIYFDGDKYVISGIGCVPDYNLPVKNFSDMTADPENFGVGFVTEKAYKKIRESKNTCVEEYTYSYRFAVDSLLSDSEIETEKKNRSKELKEQLKDTNLDYKASGNKYLIEYVEGQIEKKNLFDDSVSEREPGLDIVSDGVKALMEDSLDINIPNLESFYENKDNPRISSDAASDVLLKRLVSLVAGAILVMLFAYVISVFIIHQINEESSVIGTLYAMGVRKKSIMAHYCLLPVFVTFFSGLVGMALGFSGIGVDFQMQDCYLYYSVPQMEKVYPTYIIAYCIVMPAAISLFVNILVINKKLSKTALSLIKNEQENLIKNAKTVSKSRDKSFLRQYGWRQLAREKRSIFTVVIGMLVALLIFMIGLDCYVLCNNVKEKNINDINYEYMYILKYPMENPPEQAEACYMKNLSMTYLDYSLDINIIGIDDDNRFYDFKTPNNQSEIVIASSTAQKYGLSVGDTMVLDDTSEGRKYAFTVSDVVDYSIGLTAYMNIEQMRELFGEDDDYYNTLVSDMYINIDSGRVWSVTTRQDIEKAAGIFVRQMMSLIVILIVVSILIFIAVMYLMLGVMIDRASFGISLVKIFGYRMKEIRRVYLDFNLYAVIAGACIGIPFVKVAADAIYPYFIANTAMGMDLHFETILYGIVFAGIVLLYLSICSILTRKIKRILPAEVLKNRE